MSEHKPEHISQVDWDAVDIPELTEEEFKRMRPVRETHPEIVAAYERGELKHRGPQKAPTKEQITIRLDRDIVEHFKRGGAGWQTRLNDTLRRAIGE
jgi:uncharacterized protein (DUF4415 family)